jgi:hypothetical protein
MRRVAMKEKCLEEQRKKPVADKKNDNNGHHSTKLIGNIRILPPGSSPML